MLSEMSCLPPLIIVMFEPARRRRSGAPPAAGGAPADRSRYTSPSSYQATSSRSTGSSRSSDESSYGHRRSDSPVHHGGPHAGDDFGRASRLAFMNRCRSRKRSRKKDDESPERSVSSSPVLARAAPRDRSRRRLAGLRGRCRRPARGAHRCETRFPVLPEVGNPTPCADHCGCAGPASP